MYVCSIRVYISDASYNIRNSSSATINPLQNTYVSWCSLLLVWCYIVHVIHFGSRKVHISSLPWFSVDPYFHSWVEVLATLLVRLFVVCYIHACHRDYH